MQGGRWAISRTIADKEVYLIQNSYMDDPDDIPVILQAVGLAMSPENLNRYFPLLKGQGRCPTLELLELFAKIGGRKRSERDEIGV